MTVGRSTPHCLCKLPSLAFTAHNLQGHWLVILSDFSWFYLLTSFHSLCDPQLGKRIHASNSKRRNSGQANKWQWKWAKIGQYSHNISCACVSLFPPLPLIHFHSNETPSFNPRIRTGLYLGQSLLHLYKEWGGRWSRVQWTRTLLQYTIHPGKGEGDYRSYNFSVHHPQQWLGKFKKN